MDIAPEDLLPAPAKGEAVPAVEIEHLTVTYEGRAVLDDLSLKIAAGRTVAISGESLSGKSILLKCMIGLVKPDNDKGIRIFGHDLATVPYRLHQKVMWDIFYVSDIATMISNMTIFENLSLPLRYRSQLTEPEIESVITKALTQVGLANYIDVRPGRLNLAQKRRAHLAGAISRSPKLVLFDELFTGIVDEELERLLGMCSPLLDADDVTVIFTGQDMTDLISVVDDFLVLSNGAIM